MKFPELDNANAFVRGYHPTGSAYTCNPPVTTTDEDWVVLGTAELTEALLSEGWSLCAPDVYEDERFTALRRGHQNLMITVDWLDFQRWLLATRIAKAFNLKEKWQRTLLFSVIVDGETQPDELTAFESAYQDATLYSGYYAEVLLSDS